MQECSDFLRDTRSAIKQKEGYDGSSTRLQANCLQLSLHNLDHRQLFNWVLASSNLCGTLGFSKYLTGRAFSIHGRKQPSELGWRAAKRSYLRTEYGFDFYVGYMGLIVT